MGQTNLWRFLFCALSHQIPRESILKPAMQSGMPEEVSLVVEGAPLLGFLEAGLLAGKVLAHLVGLVSHDQEPFFQPGLLKSPEGIISERFSKYAVQHLREVALHSGPLSRHEEHA